MITKQQALERAYAALSAAAFAHPSASDDIGTQCSEAAKELRQYIEQQAEDAKMLDWLTRKVSGKAMREAGVVWPAWSPEYARTAIRAAMAEVTGKLTEKTRATA